MYRAWCRQGAILFMETFGDEWERNAGKRCLLQGSLLCTNGHSVLLQACAFSINLMQAATAAKEEIPSAVFSWTSRFFRAAGAWQSLLSISWQLQPIEELAGIAAPGKYRAAPREDAHKSSQFQLTFQVWLLWDFRFGGLLVFVLFLKKSEVQRVLGWFFN